MSPNAKQRKENRTSQGKNSKEKEGKDFIAVRWPSTLRKPLKVAAAGNDPPLTMTQYLTECFNDIQDRGGLDKKASASSVNLQRTDKERRKRYQEASTKLFQTQDRRLIDCVILLLEYAAR